MTTQTKDRSETRLGQVAALELAEARDTVHWAVQIAAAAGATLLPARADFSHTSLGYRPRSRSLAGEPLGEAARAFRAAVLPDGLRLALITEDDSLVAERPLGGCTIAEGLAWLAEVIAARAGGPARPLVRPQHELPDHPAARGVGLSVPPAAALVELTNWYACAHELVGEVATRHPEASPLRCWPHHFDLATLLSLDPGKDPEHARSIGVGLSPGDASSDASESPTGGAKPYFYVTPWPYPKTADLPPLPEGARWHREGWTGAVLGATAVAARQTVADQRTAIRAFLDRAIAASAALLGA